MLKYGSYEVSYKFIHKLASCMASSVQTE
jgi:hypothetical protein